MSELDWLDDEEERGLESATMTNQEPKTIRLFCEKGYEVHNISMEKCLKCTYFGKPCITCTPPSFEVIERLERDSDD